MYENTAQPLIQRVTQDQGAVALLLMYGQTGSGKTFTMTAIEVRLDSANGSWGGVKGPIPTADVVRATIGSSSVLRSRRSRRVVDGWSAVEGCAGLWRVMHGCGGHGGCWTIVEGCGGC